MPLLPKKEGDEPLNDVDPETGEMSQANAVNAITEAFSGVELRTRDDDDPRAIQARIARKIMSHDNLDDMFDALDSQASDRLVGRSFEIKSVEFDIYHADDGDVPLAVVQSIDLKTGQPEEWVTTAVNLTSFLANAVRIEALPFKCKIGERTTGRGQKALRFERA